MPDGPAGSSVFDADAIRSRRCGGGRKRDYRHWARRGVYRAGASNLYGRLSRKPTVCQRSC
jgi:hypothetical protein